MPFCDGDCVVFVAVDAFWQIKKALNHRFKGEGRRPTSASGSAAICAMSPAAASPCRGMFELLAKPFAA